MAGQLINLDDIATQYLKTLIPGVDIIQAQFKYNYDKLTVQLDPAGLVYETQEDIRTPILLKEDRFINNTSTENFEEFDVQQDTSATFSWTLSQGIEVGVETTFSVGIPLIEDSEITLNMDLSFSSTETQETQKTQIWQHSTHVNVAPRTCVVAKFVYTESTMNPGFTANLWISGTVGCTVNSQLPNGNWYKVMNNKPIPASELYGSAPGAKVSGDKLILPITGTFSGVQGLYGNTETTEYELDCVTPSSKATPANTQAGRFSPIVSGAG